MASSSRAWSVYAAAILLRLAVFVAFPGLADTLQYRPELSTPISSIKRIREGAFLYQRGLDPYDGGTFHQAPLLLPIYSLLNSSLLEILFSTALDILSAECLVNIVASGAAIKSSTFTSSRRGWTPTSVAVIFLFNPFTLASCLARSTTSVTIAFTLLSIQYACNADPVRSAFAIAVSTYLSLHPILVVPALGMLCFERRKNAAFVPTFFAVLGILLLTSRAILPSWRFLRVYLTPLTLPDLSPNPGLWWYFFIEMFDAFREFFLSVFWLHMLAYSIPLCLRLRKQPLAAVCAVVGTVTIFQPYANAADAGAWLSLLCVFGHTFELSSAHRYTFTASAALLYAALLGPAFHHLWIVAGSGNANFFYAITLVWSLALLILLTDFIYAVIRDEWEVERPEAAWKEARQI